MESRKINFNSAGFTLVELVVVIAIIAILAGIALPRFLEAMEASRQATDLDNARTAESLATVRYISDSESGKVSYYFDRDTGRVLKESEVSSISGYGQSEIATTTDKATWETIYNTNDITNISGTPKADGVSGIVRIEIDPDASDRDYDIHAYWEQGFGGGENGRTANNIVAALKEAITDPEKGAARLSFVTQSYDYNPYGYVYVDGEKIIASTKITMELLYKADLVSNEYWRVSRKESQKGTDYQEVGSTSITCSATDAYDAYQIIFRKNNDGGIDVTAVAVKDGQDATKAFCEATGLTADSSYTMQYVNAKKDWGNEGKDTKYYFDK